MDPEQDAAPQLGAEELPETGLQRDVGREATVLGPIFRDRSCFGLGQMLRRRRGMILDPLRDLDWRVFASTIA